MNLINTLTKLSVATAGAIVVVFSVSGSAMTPV